MPFKATTEVERFDEATDWFLSRVVITGPMAAGLHGKAVADSWWIGNSLQLDQIQRVFDKVAKALEEGTPFDEWRKQVRKELRNDAHAETVFRNAVQRAYNAGRWEQMHQPDVLRFRPFLLYDAILDSRTTEVCELCNGTLLPADDPFWQTHVPPLHHRCRSSLRNLRRTEAEKRGITPSAPDTSDLRPPGEWGHPPTAAGWRPAPDRYDPALKPKLTDKAQRDHEGEGHIPLPAPPAHHDPAFWKGEYAAFGDAQRSLTEGRAAFERGLDSTVATTRTRLAELDRASVPGVQAALKALDGLPPDHTLRQAGAGIPPLGKVAALLSGHLDGLEAHGKLPGQSGLGRHHDAEPVRAFYGALVGKKLGQPLDTKFIRNLRKRAYARGASEVSWNTPTSLAHEWAHTLEAVNRELLDSAVAYLQARTKGESIQQLRTLLGPGYGYNEVAKPDKFTSPYVGRWYYSQLSGFHGTEIGSMALELLFANSSGSRTLETLASEDFEHLMFALGQLRR